MGFQPDSPELRAFIKNVADSGKDWGGAVHATYPATVEHATHMAVHTVSDPGMNNPKTQEMITVRRPNEDEAVREHRQLNYRQNTLAQYKKIKNTLEKVFNPKLTATRYPEFPLPINSTLELYINNMPMGKGGKTVSLGAYTRDIAFEGMLRDANGVIAIIPKPETIESETEFLEPIPVLFPSKKVLDFGPTYYLLLSDMESWLKPGGVVLFLIDDEYIHLIIQTDDQEHKKTFVSETYFFHGLGEIPVVPMKGDEEKIHGDPINYSYISGILPNFDEALVLKSDYQAVTVRIAYPIPWQMKTRCNRCKGKRKVASGAMGGQMINCSSCKGTGIQAALGPGDGIYIDPKEMADGKIPNPPGGFIQPSSFARELREDIVTEINAGLASVCMDHLRKDTNIQESGEAKRVGREDLNTFMDVIANAIYSIQDDMAHFIAAMRYGAAGLNPAEIVPIVEKPTDYDLLSTGDHINRVGTAKNQGVSPSITQKMELDLMQKAYGDDSGVFQMARAIHGLDPLPNLKPDEAIQVEPFTRDVDMFVHFNIERLVKRAEDENPAFFAMDRPEQLEIVYGFAEAEMEEMEPNIPPVPPPPPPT